MVHKGDLFLILNQYDLKPKAVEQQGNILKVETAKESYAVKRMVMSDTELKGWTKAIQNIETEPVNMLPLLSTKFGGPYVRFNQYVYYVMPWLDEDPSVTVLDKIRALFMEAGALHRYTKTDQAYDEGFIYDEYQRLVYQWTQAQKLMENLAYRAEHRIYPSPFEQHVLNHVHGWLTASEEAKRLLESWRQSVTESKTVRTVLCHGRLIPSHLLIVNGTHYLTHFDHVRPSLPCYDLAHLLRRSSVSVQWTPEGWSRLLDEYEEHYLLSDDERQLLQALLTFPEPIMTTLLDYIKADNRESEMDDVRLLEQQRRRLSQLRGIVHHLAQGIEMGSGTNVTSTEDPSLNPTFDKTNIETGE